MKDPLELYIQHAIYGKSSWISEMMKNTIPSSMRHAITLAKIIKEEGAGVLSADLKERMGKIIENTTKNLGFLTEKAKQHLDRYYQGGLAIEVAHQPKFLGGERFIFNKLACGASLSALDDNSYPFFYLADYDKVHPELIKTHFSLSNSATGFSLSIKPEILKEYNNTCIRTIPLPSNDDLEDLIETIYSNYQFSINSCIKDYWHRKLLEERLESALRFLKICHHQAKDFNGWFLNMIGLFVNIISDQGYLFLISSDKDYRKLLIPFYEQILKNRKKYVKSYMNIHELFIKNNYRPPLRDIEDDFVPFFLECQNQPCHKNRIQLHARENDNRLILVGACDRCRQHVEIELHENRPDLSDIGINLSPRVETRQYLVQKSIAPFIHVAGTGETRYYTMSIPLMSLFDENLVL
ncbi:MAG: hypothetical protein ACTSRA_20475, partial [Promethearchaeota archaeon]